ncbi:MAG: helix-turn-helix domain-containing protein [Clostridia bacterium]|nr:helix-turn-helix domain-containing protein [Clostridia bacterium]
MDLGEKIKRLRCEQGLTLEEVGRRTGVGKSTVRKWESGQIANMRRDKIALVAKALGVSPAYLMGWTPEAAPADKRERAEGVPLIGAIAAGEPILAEESWDVFVDGPRNADYALRVAGDSMEPTFLDGDIVYIRRQADVDDGSIAAVLIDDTAALKRVYHVEDGLQLVSDNRKYPPRLVAADDHGVLRILGSVVGFTRLF